MKGRITFVTRPEFDAWLERKTAEQDATQPVPEASGEIVAN
jgi:heme/copper-type cytochrome/quinol oxidase subunit 2